MDKNRKAFEQWCLENGYFDEIEDSGTTTARFDDNMFIAWQAATAAAEFERNNLLAVIAEKDKALLSAKHAIKGREHTGFIDKALSISPDNCKLVPKAWMAMSGSFEMIASTKDKLPDSVADAAIQLFTISTINDTISGRGVE
jgi:hypothetical protein